MRRIPILTLSMVAAAAINARRFVGFDRLQIGVAGKVAMGVAEYAASAAGKQIAVDVMGTTTVESGAAFAEGALIKSDAQGRAIDQAGAGAVLARALQPAGAAGQPVEVLLLPSRDAIA